MRRGSSLLLLGALVLVFVLPIHAGSDCLEDLANPSLFATSYENSGKWLADPGDFENCRASFPNTTFCILVADVAGSETSPTATPAAALSLCAPASCAADIEEDWQILLPYIGKYVPLTNTSYAKCGKWNQLPKLPTGARVMLCVLTVFGSLLGFVEHRLFLNSAPYVDPETEITRGHEDEEGLVSGRKMAAPYAGAIPAFFRCFSVFHNLPRLVADDHSTLSFLNVSIMWVITGHTLLWFYTAFSNTTDLRLVIQKLYMQLLWNAPFSVDTFFFMSGLLVAYLSYGAMTKGIFSWLLYYVHRYVRLTPVYLFWILIYWKLLPYIATGPFYDIRINLATGDCASGWWRNILYINNLAHTGNMCHPVSWYLGNDMQFYIIAPILVYIFYRSRRMGMGLLGALLLGSIMANWIYTGTRHALGGFYQATFAEQIAINNWVYVKPWMRAVSYLVGVGAGLFIASTPNLRIPALFRYVTYCTGAAIALTSLIVLLSTWKNFVQDEPSAWWGYGAWAAYYGLSRTAWAISLACMSIPFAAGYGDFVRRFLGASFWTPLARLTFGAYLIHPLFLSYYLATLTTQLRYTFRNWMQWSLFVIVIAFGLSLISYLILEKPLMNIEAWITKLLRGSSARHANHKGDDERKGINDTKE